MADEELLHKVHGLGDLDLAALLCLVGREHCIISTEPEALDDLVEELQLVASHTFNLKSTVVTCGPETTLDDFAASILLSQSATSPRSPNIHASPSLTHDSYFPSPKLRAATRSPLSKLSSTTAVSRSAGGHQHQSPQTPHIANVILARDIDKAPKAVQIQALELLRTRRIFTRTSVQTAPKQFLFIAVLGAKSGGEARCTEHLNDFFYIAHWHDPLDGFAHLEERDEEEHLGRGDREDDEISLGSAESVVKRRSSALSTPRAGFLVENATGNDGAGRENRGNGGGGVFNEGDIAALAIASGEIHVDVEVLRYQMNIISFLRMHRAVGGGIVPVATKHFDQLVRCLATLHGLDYVTPSLVGLAARKIYLHRIRIVEPERERSMQWGSDLEAVKQLLDGVGPEDIIEDVLGAVSVPL